MLVVDNGSVFTSKISDFLESSGVGHDMLAFSQIGSDELQKHDSVILSGRKNNDKLMNATNSRIIRHCVEDSKKLLGICYGAELLALTLGGTIRKISVPQKGETKITPTKPNPLISNPMTAYESHGYEMSKLGPLLESVASSDSCTHEIIQHKYKKIFGTQFHPEMTGDGKKLISIFLEL